MIKTYPLASISIEEAMQLQFKLIDTACHHFTGTEILSLGDLGVVPGINKPKTTLAVEETLSQFFGTEKTVLIRGSGTGAIRYALFAVCKAGEKILVHDAPVYNTTESSFQMMGLQPVRADYNRAEEIDRVLEETPDIHAALVQLTRQRIEDSYDYAQVIARLKAKGLTVITDDNYAVMKVSKIGCQSGSDVSCFSAFKLLGPEGIGVVTGKAEIVDKIISIHYSGGMQVQGHEALEVLRGLTYAPVALAIQAAQVEECVRRLNAGEVKGVKGAFAANAQSKVLIVELENENAPAVLEQTEKLGAAPNPVGCESKYEFLPMFYRVSGTFIKADPSLKYKMIRVNPMRAGSDTILRILDESIRAAQ